MIKQMYERLTSWEPLRQVLNREIIAYLICGALTTVLALGVYQLCIKWLSKGRKKPTAGVITASNTITFIIAVMFAFFTNRYFVFQSQDWNTTVVLQELGKFYAGRLLVTAAETGLLVLFVDRLKFPNMPCKLVSTVLVTISNYIISKWWIF